VTGGAAELVDKTRPIRDQAAGSDEKALVVDCGQLVPSRQRDDQIAMSCRQWASRYDQAAIRAAREGRDGVLNLAWLAHAKRTQFHSYRWRHGLDSAKLAGPGGYGGIANDGRSGHLWRELLEQFQPLPDQAVFVEEESSGGGPWPRQTVDIAGAHRVDHSHKHDRHGAGRLYRGCRGGAGSAKDDVRRECDQFFGVSTTAVEIRSAPAVIDSHVVTDGPSQLRQRLHECSDAGLCFLVVCGLGHEHADAPHPLALLPARRKRPRCRRAAEQRDELAPFHHSITSSARASRLSGTVRPSAFAVLRLITSSPHSE